MWNVLIYDFNFPSLLTVVSSNDTILHTICYSMGYGLWHCSVHARVEGWLVLVKME
jgi:hypothetical protein